MTPQVIGGLVILAALAVLGYWVWSTWFKTASTGTTTGTQTGTTTGTAISAVLDTAQLTANLSYIELLSKINVVKASPDAVKACEVLADTLWQGAIADWKAAQVTVEPTVAATVTKTAKVTATDGTVVEVPVS